MSTVLSMDHNVIHEFSYRFAHKPGHRRQHIMGDRKHRAPGICVSVIAHDDLTTWIGRVPNRTKESTHVLDVLVAPFESVLATDVVDADKKRFLP